MLSLHPSSLSPSTAAMLSLSSGCAAMLASVLMHSRGLAPENREHVTRRALGHWLPIAVVVLTATILKHADLAISLVFGTAVAAMSGVTGFLLIAGRDDGAPPFAQRVWLFAPIPVILVFALGARGHLLPRDALLLLAQGLLLVLLWVDAPAGDEPRPIAREGLSRRLAWKGGELLLCLGLCAAGAWLAIRGTEQMASLDRRYPFIATGTTILSVVLAMPIVNTSWQLAASGRIWAPLTSQLGVVFLNLCVLLPAVILLAGTGLSTAGWDGLPSWSVVVYPRVAWRLDTLALLVLSLLYVPAACGRLRFDWRLAPWLICGYCAYLLAVLVANTRH